MNAEKFLNRAIHIEEEINQYRKELADIELQNLTPSYSGMNVKKSGKKEATFESPVDKYVDLIGNKLLELSETKAEIFKVIDVVDDEKLHRFLMYRFLNGYSAEKTGELMHYSRRQSFRVQKKAVKEVDKILKMALNGTNNVI